MARKVQQKLWTGPFIVGTIANFVMTINYFMLMVVMTSYTMAAYDAPESLAAFTASIFIIGTLFARLFSGAVMDRIGRKRLALLGVVCVSLFTVLYLFVTSLGVLLGLRFLHGFAYGTFSTCMATVISSIVPNERKGEGIGYYMLSVTLGAAIGPFSGIMISSHLDFHWLFIIATAAALLSFACAVFMKVPKTGARAMASVKAKETTSLAEDISEAAVVDAPELPGEYDRVEASASASRQGSLIGRFIEVGVLPIACVAGLIFFGYSALLTFLTPYAETIGLTRAASVFFIVYALSMFVTRPFTGKAFDRRGPRPVMIPAFVSFMVGMVMIGMASNDWLLLASALFLGYGVGTIQSCGLAMAVRTTPDARLSLANATYYILVDAGVGVGPLLLGFVIPAIGYRNMYLSMVVVGIIALVLFLFVTRKRSVAREG